MKEDEYKLQREVYRILESVDWKDHGEGQGKPNYNVEKKEVVKYLCCAGYSEYVAKRAAEKLEEKARQISEGLRKANIYMADIILNNIKVFDENDDIVEVRLINYNNPLANNFYFKHEVSVFKNDKEKRRIDIVGYINGIALVVIELKNGNVEIEKAIRQTITDQSEDEIPRFFTTVAVCIGGNNSEGMKLATVGTDERHYYTWREDAFTAYPEEVDEVTKQIHTKVEKLSGSIIEKQLVSFLDKRRFIDYIQHFIVVEQDVRKACRYNQFYAIKRANERRNRFFNGDCDSPNGIVEHGPGSGKTITMEADANLFLKYDPTPDKNRQVIILVDRTDLQDQNFDNFSWLNPDIVESSATLLKDLNDPTKKVLVVIINKFGHIADGHGGHIEIEKAFDDFAGKVKKRQRLVENDEAHRTQSGTLHDAMRRVLPEDLTCYTGYTGTSDTSDSDTSTLKRYGNFIHAYDSSQAEEDGAIVPICYEAREISQNITSPDMLDEYFADKLEDVNDIVKERVKAAWATDSRLKGVDGWIRSITNDILTEFMIADARLMAGEGNALLIVPTIDRAFAYWEVLRDNPFFAGQVYPITSYRPSTGDVRTARSSIDTEDVTSKTYRLACEMFGDVDPDEFERDIKKKFIKHPDQMKLLIIVDKLNTGFDAPPISTIFIDREMKSHALVFQAINRGNRCDGRDNIKNVKDKCHVIDYSGNFDSYRQAVKQYTLETVLAIANGKDPKQALEDSMSTDAGKGTVSDAHDMYIRDYQEALESLKNLCSAIPSPQGDEQYNEYFCGSAFGVHDDMIDGEELVKRTSLRREFYRAVNNMARRWHEARPYFIDRNSKKEADEENIIVNNWIKKKDGIALVSGDRFDAQAYSDIMDEVLDKFINTASRSNTLFNIEESFVKLFAGALSESEMEQLVSTLGTKDGSSLFLPIAGKISKEIVLESGSNAVYGEKLSEKLQAILDKRNENKKDAEKFKQEVNRELVELAQQVASHDYTAVGTYPASINSNMKIALYDNVTENDEIKAVKIFDILQDCYTSAWNDPEIPLSDSSFKQTGRRLKKKFNFDNREIHNILKIARKNISEMM